MFRGIKRAALGLGALLALLAALFSLCAAVAVYRPGALRPLIERFLRPPGGSASLDGLEVSLRPPLLVLRGLEVRGPGAEDRVRLERLRAVPILGRVLGTGPWLQRLEVQGLEVRRHLSGAGGGGPPDLSPLSRLFAVEDLSVREARLDLEVGGTAVTVAGLSLTLAPAAGEARELALDAEVGLGPPGGTQTRGRLRGAGRITPGPALSLRLELAVPGFELGDPSGLGELDSLGGDLEASADLAVSPERLDLEDLALELSGARLRWPSGEGWELGTVRASLGGGVGLDGSDPRFDLSRLDVGGLLRARGSLSGRSLAEPDGWLEGTLPDVARLKAGPSPLFPAALRDFAPEGELPFRLEGRAGRIGPALVLELELQPEAIVLSWPSQGLEARLGGTLRVTTPLDAPIAQAWTQSAVEGRLEAVADLVRPPLAVRSVRVALPLSGSVSALRSPEASLSL
ncbi:MAG: hypothetical protein AB1578_09950, partial [Thermodesulfobacteriota bacterium]